MGKYVQVALTYLYRPRFWILGPCYLLASRWWGGATATYSYSFPQMLCSTSIACVVACFIALHLRRQFAVIMHKG
jgi:hypothetical protein